MIDKKKILIQFGKNLRVLRDSKKVSQEKLALSIGFDRTYISLLERGKRNPSLIAIYKIAEELEIQPADLMPKI